MYNHRENVGVLKSFFLQILLSNEMKKYNCDFMRTKVNNFLSYIMKDKSLPTHFFICDACIDSIGEHWWALLCTLHVYI